MAITAESIKYRLDQERSVELRTARLTGKPVTFSGRLLAKILRWRDLSRQRRELAQLSDRSLDDIGISRTDALSEANRRFWDDPYQRN